MNFGEQIQQKKDNFRSINNQFKGTQKYCNYDCIVIICGYDFAFLKTVHQFVSQRIMKLFYRLPKDWPYQGQKSISKIEKPCSHALWMVQHFQNKQSNAICIEIETCAD